MDKNPFLNIGVSLEENDLNVTINAEHEGDATDEDIESLDTSDTPEAAELDLADAGKEAEDEIDNAETADDAVEALENIYTALENINLAGGTLTTSGSLMFKVAVNNATKKIPGLNYETMNLPSMESFESSPYSSLNVAMEGVGDMIQKGYQAIIEFFKNIGNKFMEFVKGLLDSVHAAETKLNKIKERASKATDNNGTGKITMSFKFSGSDVVSTIGQDMNGYITWYKEVTAVLDDVLDHKYQLSGSKQLGDPNDDIRSFQRKVKETSLHYVVATEQNLSLSTHEVESNIEALTIDNVSHLTKSMISDLGNFSNVSRSANDVRNKKLKAIQDNLLKEAKKSDTNLDLEQVKKQRHLVLEFIRFETAVVKGFINYVNQVANILDKSITIRSKTKDS